MCGKASGVRSRAKADRRSAAVLAVAAAALLGSGAARAQVVYDLAPSAGFGITDNARLTPVGERDEFSVLATAVRLRRIGARSDHGIGYRLAWTHYYEGKGIDNLSNELTALANFNLSAKLDLHLVGNAVLSRVSSIPLGNPATGAVQGIARSSALFLSVGASEELVYRPDARWQYLENVGVMRLTYLESPAPPDTLSMTARARVDRIAGLDSYSLQASGLGSFGVGRTVIAQLMAGWRREISLRWTSEIQAGAMGIFRSNVSPSVGPAANATVGYRRLTWFASFTLSRIPTQNLFLGEPTVNNQAIARLTLPLIQSEMLVISGMAGYVYANLASDQFTRAFDQRLASASLAGRFGRLPLFGSLEYSVIDQNGNATAATTAPSLFRQVLMLNLTASFTFGPGTPPIMGTPM